MNENEKVATPWGGTTVVERVSLPQRAGERRFVVHVELLETRQRGERMVRIARYDPDKPRFPAPATLRPRDLDRLRAALGFARSS